ncbi:Initiator tRNA phosphoribosyl transferase [Mycena venus]|uniref:Initiator tRNA phosphoribosyl transferase n=1 Tax=Mycena venus TaxID=2733690 RepID=A0A8H6YNS5_9AGAR|nr:Initiator tRNA phosphoribosyl transferase [Mycena venus]
MFDAQRETSEALAFLRKESLDLFNRLHSIAEDVAFVDHVHNAYPDIPILPNLRCGAWYTNPAIATDCPAYFKSTDGHFSNWSFNLRRPNLHLLPLVAANDGAGIVLVDSTRAGKRLPDALAKTVPIWMTGTPRCIRPPAQSARKEHAQIARRIDAWANALATSSYSLPNLPRPLRPVWLTPASGALPVPPPTHIPIICVSASQVADGAARRAGGFAYIQGSGDDHELWGEGLTPELFWCHREALLEAERGELSTLIARLVANSVAEARGTGKRSPTPITRVHGKLLVCATADLAGNWEYDTNTAYVLVTGVGIVAPEAAIPVGPRLPVLRIETWTGKKGQFQFLQDILPRTIAFARAQLRAGRRLCVACDTGTDFSVGIALAALQLFFDDEGELIVLDGEQGKNDIYMDATVANKDSIRTRLEWIIASRPEANPSRTTLKRVNEFLLSSREFRAPPARPFPSQQPAPSPNSSTSSPAANTQPEPAEPDFTAAR